MNTFKIEKYGDTQYQLQFASESGFGTHIICTAAELDQLRELLAPMAWQDRPSGEGKYLWLPYSDMPIKDGQISDVWFRKALNAFVALIEKPEPHIEKCEYFGGLWLKLPDVPVTEGK